MKTGIIREVKNCRCKKVKPRMEIIKETDSYMVKKCKNCGGKEVVFKKGRK